MSDGLQPRHAAELTLGGMEAEEPLAAPEDQLPPLPVPHPVHDYEKIRRVGEGGTPASPVTTPSHDAGLCPCAALQGHCVKWLVTYLCL